MGCDWDHPFLAKDEWEICVDLIGYEPGSRKEADEMLAPYVKASPGRRTSRTGANSPKHDEAVAAARKSARSNGWPALTGSTKQKRWGEQLRASLVPRIPETLQATAVREFKRAQFWIEYRENLSGLTAEVRAVKSREDEMQALLERKQQERAAQREAAIAQAKEAGINIASVSARIFALSTEEFCERSPHPFGDYVLSLPDGTHVYLNSLNEFVLRRPSGKSDSIKSAVLAERDPSLRNDLCLIACALGVHP